MAKKKIPWFRIYATNRGALENIDNEKVGAALKAALLYFDTHGEDKSIEANISDPTTRIAFGIFKQGIDDSIKEYEERREDGKRGAAAKKEKERQALINELSKQYGGNEEEPNPAFR